MQESSLFGLVATIFALQFLVFGWRIQREISVGDQARRTWFPVEDYLNVLALGATIVWGILLPLKEGRFPPVSRRCLAASAVILACHPVSMMAHYGLVPWRAQRPRNRGRDDFDYFPLEEIITVIATVVLAGFTVWLVP